MSQLKNKKKKSFFLPTHIDIWAKWEWGKIKECNGILHWDNIIVQWDNIIIRSWTSSKSFIYIPGHNSGFKGVTILGSLFKKFVTNLLWRLSRPWFTFVNRINVCSGGGWNNFVWILCKNQKKDFQQLQKFYSKSFYPMTSSSHKKSLFQCFSRCFPKFFYAATI